ncbi:hypothetical protein [Anaeromyxobacter dehalogenans]|uniref:hypothetical protein n=1 Tax=Anaeromyxobacter dehalogenans TaxID=161493 RepID=UPI0012ED3600|nr:hypothetical protein [Anaeromyxobacter dehalogenans]
MERIRDAATLRVGTTRTSGAGMTVSSQWHGDEDPIDLVVHEVGGQWILASWSDDLGAWLHLLDDNVQHPEATLEALAADPRVKKYATARDAEDAAAQILGWDTE